MFGCLKDWIKWVCRVYIDLKPVELLKAFIIFVCLGLSFMMFQRDETNRKQLNCTFSSLSKLSMTVVKRYDLASLIALFLFDCCCI